MKKKLSLCSMLLALSFGSQAGLLGLDLLEVGDDPNAEIVNTLVDFSSGITLIPGSEAFVGRLGDGANLDTAQSGIFGGVNITDGTTSVTMGSGVILTSGTANVPDSNTQTAWSVLTDTGGDADLSQLLVDAGAPNSETNDTNFIEFGFTLDDTLNSIALDFVFGSDEFPDQSVTDVFAVFVDDVNYAFFSDGSLVSFVEGANASNFIDNNAGLFNIEYDGFSNVLTLIGLVDESRDSHTIKIAIADTSDQAWDSGVFLSNMRGNLTDGGGGVDPDPQPVNAPMTFVMLSLGLAGLFARRTFK